jgi:hypothetical protein
MDKYAITAATSSAVTLTIWRWELIEGVIERGL